MLENALTPVKALKTVKDQANQFKHTQIKNYCMTNILP